MIAVDTNVVVRLLTADHPAQAARARRLFATETIWLPKTVILESEWVLRRLYQIRPGEVIEALRQLIALSNVTCEDEAGVFEALDWADKGLDFADALHLASARATERFVTFDSSMAKRARSAAARIPVTAP